MKAQEDFAPWSSISAVIDRFNACRAPEEAIAALQTLVPEFVHRRDNDDQLYRSEQGG